MMRLAIGLLAIAACGDNLGAAPDAAQPDSDQFTAAAHTALPIVVPHHHVILANPRLVTITYTDYPLTAMTEAWADAVVTSSWWTKVGADYGIGAMTHAASYTIPMASPTTLTQDTDLEAQIQTLITNSNVPTPATGDEYIFMIYVPKTVPLGDSLQGLAGYHAQLATGGGVRFSYAVVVDDGTGIASTTTTAAHELIEASTDPYDPPNDGWYTDPAVPDPWYLVQGEVADLCNFEPVDQEGDFTYQRIWSTSAAAAGANPCVPNVGDPWYTVSASPATMPTVAKGGTATFTLTGWSTAVVDNWNLSDDTADYSDYTAQQINPSFSSTIINNGKTVMVTLHVPSAAQSGKYGGVYIYSGEYYRPWPLGFRVQ